MRFNPLLKQQVLGFLDYHIVVEGKKDIQALNEIGFQRVYPVHITGVPLKQRVEELAGQFGRKAKVCILTDFDKKGKTLYLLLKGMFQEFGIKTDSTLRGVLLKAGISHIEGLSSFFEKVGKI